MGMGASSGRRRLSHLRGVRAVVCVFACITAGGCLPGADSEDGGLKAALGKFTSDEETRVNRAEKKDALISMRAVDELGENIASTVRSVRRAGEHLVSIDRGPSVLDAGPGLAEAEPPVIETALAPFYASLAALEARKTEKPVTIVHLGDDHIASDRFSGDLREQFQSRFGRAGRGMLPPGVYPSRGVKFDRGGQWRALSSAEGAPGMFGATGVKLVGSGPDAWLRLTSVDGPFDWVEVTLETGPKQGAAIIAVDGETKTVPTAAPSADWKKIRLNRQGRELTIRAKGDGDIKVHSWMIGSQRAGVNYVNLGLQRASALTADRWSPSLLAADLKSLEPNLIVLGYGTVEGFDDRLNIAAYEKRVVQIITRLKSAAPDAAVLIIGPPDAARMPDFAAAQGGGMNACRSLTALETARYHKWMEKSDMRIARWHAPPKLGEVRAALKRIAAHTGSYFWDWSKIMGGPCGIHAWAHAQPALASGDHVQLTAEGAKRSARSLFNELMGGYGAYANAAAAAAVSAASRPTPVAARPKR
ncbi:MAG: hypothetical protein NW215_01970 [Hyphomicrobiales bacterium]|nr:hypothetical protein [Hyphomicrobiales bacterium]